MFQKKRKNKQQKTTAVFKLSHMDGQWSIHEIKKFDSFRGEIF